MVSESDIVTIIVPVYNTDAFLSKCLNDIAIQTYDNIQTIIVDDGSVDESAQFIDGFLWFHDNVIVVHKTNGGVSSARNCGLDLATGDYVTFADSDDQLHPKLIEKLHSLLGSELDVIASCEYSFESLGSPKEDSGSGDMCLFSAIDGIVDMLCNEHITYSVYCKLFPMGMIDCVRFETEYCYHEDLLFCYEAFLRCKYIRHISEKLYHYCMNDASAIHAKFSKKSMTAIDVQDDVLLDIQNRFPNTELANVAEEQYLKVNIYTCFQMMNANYGCHDDFIRVRNNLRNRIGLLLMSSLAMGYKAYGLAISVLPRSILRLVMNARF